VKRLFTNFILLFLSCHAFAQTYSVTVTNGYGTGNYNPGDTVYAFAKEFGYDSEFVSWTINPASLKTIDDAREWRFRFIMPAQNITVKAKIQALLDDNTIKYEKIEGKDTLKNVYYSFPHNQKGVVFIFHGSGSRADAWIGTNNFDRFNLTKDLIAAGYGVIITECEEATLNKDLNGDGRIAWNVNPLDSVNNVDYANLAALRDTFKRRGNIRDTTKLFSIGMSAGGFLSSAFSYYFNCAAGISYCAPSDTGIVTKTTVPFMFCIAPNDHVITLPGNMLADSDFDTLQLRGICSNFYKNEVFPIYPQYFARSDSISIEQSKNIYSELLANNFASSKGFLLFLPLQIDSMAMDEPSTFKTFNNLSASENAQVIQLLNIAYGDHEFYSDHDKRSIAFLDSLCISFTGVPNIQNPEQTIKINPNPVNQSFTVQLPSASFDLFIFDEMGRKVFEQKNATGILQIDFSSFSNGIYFLKAQNPLSKLSAKFIKQ
jgi:hypothetical protein